MWIQSGTRFLVVSRMALVAVAISFSATAAFAQAPAAASGAGWYTGFGVGQSRLGFKTGDFAIGPAGTSTSFDENDTAFKFFAGYRVLPWLAIEGGYDNLGKSRVSYVNAGGTANLDYRVDAVKVAGVGSFAFGNTGFSAFGKLGFGYARVRENTSGFPAVVGRADVSERDYRATSVIGAGLQYQLPRGLALRAEYEHYNEVGESPLPVGRARAGLWSLSLMYLF
ncbi:MAG: outer membrane beta-barrel protein [Proteobacteria bacterium]|nr:outer membrane beta-barrel protein [Burkholderiales bacterium]